MDCGPNVSTGVGFISAFIAVEPSGGDDTETIQCAIDAANENGIPSVSLRTGTFTITSIQVDGYVGNIIGNGQSSTIIEIENGSVDCEEILQSGRAAAGIKFSGGQPEVRNLTIRATDPCDTDGWEFYILHFTGDIDGCSDDVVFGLVDRVTIDSAGFTSATTIAVGVMPEGLVVGGCKDTLLGTFKLNRSTIYDTTFGVISTIKGAGQVDINFNDFAGNYASIFVINANQNLTITGNDFRGIANSRNGGHLAVSVGTNDSDFAPATNRAVIHKNTFRIEDDIEDGTSSAAVALLHLGRDAALSTVITENTIDTEGPEALGVAASDVQGGYIGGNIFRGDNAADIFLYPDTVTNMRDWSIVGNNFRPSTSIAGDIVLDAGTTQCIVGPGQQGSVSNRGNGNSVLGEILTTKRNITEYDDVSRTYGKILERLSFHVSP